MNVTISTLDHLAHAVRWRLMHLFFLLIKLFYSKADFKFLYELRAYSEIPKDAVSKKRISVAVDIRRNLFDVSSRHLLKQDVYVNAEDKTPKIRLEYWSPVKPKSVIISSSTESEKKWKIHFHYTSDLQSGKQVRTIFINL